MAWPRHHAYPHGVVETVMAAKDDPDAREAVTAPRAVAGCHGVSQLRSCRLPLVEPIARAFDYWKWIVAWDQDNPNMGENWGETIEPRVAASYTLLVAWSKKSVKSEAIGLRSRGRCGGTLASSSFQS